jgi:hypothetical protein
VVLVAFLYLLVLEQLRCGTLEHSCGFHTSPYMEMRADVDQHSAS